MASDILFLRLDGAQSSWVALDAEGRRLTPSQRGPLGEALPSAEGRRLVVLVPACDVMRTRANVPVKSAARLRQVLPYSLEENLAEDVEDLQFAVGARTGADGVEVAVVAHERMAAWREQLSEAGLTANEICSEAEGVPDTPGALTLVLEGTRIYGRLPEKPPFMLEGLALGQLLAVLQTARDTEAEPQKIERLLVYTDRTAYEAQSDALAALRAELASVDVKLLEEDALGHLATTLAAHPGINLLQGRYAPRSDWAALARPWRLAASLAAALVVLGLVGLGTEHFTLSRRDSALSELVTSGCQRLGAARMSACRSEIDRRLAAAGAAPSTHSGFLDVLAAIAASRDPSSRITALSFRQGVLDLRVVAPSVPALDDFVRRMKDASFTVSIQSASPGDNGVEGQLQIVEDHS